MCGEDKIEGGRMIEEGMAVAQLLEAAGADAVHVSAGIAPSVQFTFSSSEMEECLLVDDAAHVKSCVHIPVIAVNRIMDIDQAAAVIDEGKADMVAMGRAFLADPDLIHKALGENDEPTRRCLGCRKGCQFNVSAAGCPQNPRLGHEYEAATL